MKNCLTALVSLLFLLITSHVLIAQVENYPDDFDEPETPPFSGSIGVGAGYVPEFVGSDKSEAKVLPIVFLNYGPVFLSTDKGLGVRFNLLQGALEISPAVNYRFQRKEGDSELLTGMGDVKDVVTLGGTVAIKFNNLVFSVKTFQGVGDVKGLTSELKAAYLNRSSDSFNYGLSISATAADKAYNQNYFGVSELQSERSGYRPYIAESGFYDMGVKGTFDFFLSPQFSVDLFAGYNQLIGPAADSPLVEKGSKDQFSTGLVFLYHFGK